jgi:hypothetical protein
MTVESKRKLLSSVDVPSHRKREDSRGEGFTKKKTVKKK